MKPTASAWFAIVSVLVSVPGASPESRPRYGGTLRVEMAATLADLDPAVIPSDPAALEAKSRLLPAVFETLVRLDETGKPQPWLATSWTHDAARRRWIFTARANVRLQDNTPWTPAASSLEFTDDRPIEQILRELSRPWSAIVVRQADGTLLGTGPFRIAKWEPQKSMTLAAHDGHWKGRPYLDSIEIQMGRDVRDQAQDLQLGKADVIDAPMGANDSAADTTLALVFDTARATAAMREAIALSIDRAAIRRVLLKGRGEISGALLPQWLSGYAFLFDTKRDPVRARQLSAGAAPLNFGYDRQDPVPRSIGERISVNATEAGITMRPSAGAADVRLVGLPVTSRDSIAALEDIGVILNAQVPSTDSGAAASYAAERALLSDFHVVPLFQLARGWSFSPKLHNWPDLANAWIGQP